MPLMIRLLDLRISYKIDVSLTVSEIGIFETVIFFGKREQRFAEKLNALAMHGYLAHSGRENYALYADYIADISLFERCIAFFAQIVAADVKLYASRAVEKMSKACLSHYSL